MPKSYGVRARKNYVNVTKVIEKIECAYVAKLHLPLSTRDNFVPNFYSVFYRGSLYRICKKLVA